MEMRSLGTTDLKTAPLVLGTAADDRILDSHYFEAVSAAFEAHPKAACVFAKALLVNAETGETYFQMAKARRAGFIPARQCLEDFLTDRMFVHGAAVVWRRSYVDKVGGYDAALGPRADFFLNLSLPALGGAVFLDEIVTNVRFSERGYGEAVDDETYFRQFALAERKLLSLDLGYSVNPQWRRTWRGNVINERLANRWQRRFIDAVRQLIAALDPWHVKRLPPDLGEIATQLGARSQEWEKAIARRVAAAEAIFDDLAGPLRANRLGNFLQSLRPRHRA